MGLKKRRPNVEIRGEFSHSGVKFIKKDNFVIAL
jgi:hypothetical protein